jgi:Recombination endonuclease VII
MTNKKRYMREYMRKYLAENPDQREAARKRAREYSRNKMPKPTHPAPKACECCGEKFTETPCIDHDHKTLLFRGWICRTCNTGIGLLGDNLEGIANALAYLTATSSGKTHYSGDGCKTHK